MSDSSSDASTGSVSWSLIVAVLAALMIGGLGTLGWLVVQQNETRHTAETIERLSWADRSALVQELETQYFALRNVAAFWSDYGHHSPELWDKDAKIELAHFPGFDTIMWNDPDRDIRYVASDQGDPSLRYRPDDEEWAALAPLREGSGGDGGERLLGRQQSDDGHTVYRLQIPSRGPQSSGMLIAAIDAHDQIESLLNERSPGYAIDVRWDGDIIYDREDAASDIPHSWQRGGLIELSIGAIWRVTHTPTTDMAARLTRPTLPGLLAANWAIALLFGAVVFQNGRVLERARAAERAEARYATLNRELENRVDERTADLETISQSIVHDIRGALNVVSLNSQRLRQAPPPEAVREAAEASDRAVAQTSGILARVQELGRIASADMERDLVDMQAVAARIAEELIDQDAVELEIDPLPSCLAQPVLTEILWHNLISNAVKYSRDAETPRVAISADSDRRPVVYRISDNGIGFDDDDAESIFAPFVRLGSNGAAGQGLGLTLVARIVRRHGGEVWAESELGSGATFFFHFGADSTPD